MSTPARIVHQRERIPFLKGRPRREESIDREDEMNLLIALGLHRDVLEICKDPHLFGA